MWWCHCVSSELLASLYWYVVCWLAWYIWWCLTLRWHVPMFPLDGFVFQWAGWLFSWCPFHPWLWLFWWGNWWHPIRRVRQFSWCSCWKVTCHWKKALSSIVDLLWGWTVCKRCRCCPSSLILPVMPIVGSLGLVVSIVESLLFAVILPPVVWTSSSSYPNHLRKCG